MLAFDPKPDNFENYTDRSNKKEELINIEAYRIISRQTKLLKRQKTPKNKIYMALIIYLLIKFLI